MIFINLDSFPLPSAEKEGVEKEDSEGKTVGVKVRNERAHVGYKTQKSGIWRVLVGGQKVKPESPNYDKKSKFWEGGGVNQRHNIWFSAWVLESWTAFCRSRWSLCSVALRGYVTGKVHVLSGNIRSWPIRSCVHHFLLFIPLTLRQKDISVCVSGNKNPSKSCSQDCEG